MPAWVQIRASLMPPESDLALPEPCAEITANMSIIPVTVPRRPSSGATPASTAMAGRPRVSWPVSDNSACSTTASRASRGRPSALSPAAKTRSSGECPLLTAAVAAAWSPRARCPAISTKRRGSTRRLISATRRSSAINMPSRNTPIIGQIKKRPALIHSPMVR